MFSSDSTCPMILWIPLTLLKISPTGLSPPTVSLPRLFGYLLKQYIAVRTPIVFLLLVQPLPLSLATTRGISFDFSSSPYLDVSVRGVPFIKLCIHLMIHGSSPWEFPHSEIRGYNAYLQLPAAYRSLSRPSSAPCAKAFTLCSCSLELLKTYSSLFSFFELLEFHKHFQVVTPQ